MAVPTDPPPAVDAGPLRDAALVAFVATTDLARAHAFYGGVLGLERTEANPYANAYDVGGTSLRVTRVEHVAPAPYTVLGWRVEDVHRAIARLGALGLEMCRFPGVEQDAEGVWSAPGGARVAWFDDPDGNRLSVSDMPPPAAS
jgi:catechol 2,3-dioxygenase-like lactoylglutathione lyase family enzyme